MMRRRIRPSSQQQSLALDNYPDMKRVNYLVITLNRGYNIGIAQSNRSESKAKTPKEWRALVK